MHKAAICVCTFRRCDELWTLSGHGYPATCARGRLRRVTVQRTEEEAPLAALEPVPAERTPEACFAVFHDANHAHLLEMA
jgi:hypothetical protein